MDQPDLQVTIDKKWRGGKARRDWLGGALKPVSLITSSVCMYGAYK